MTATTRELFTAYLSTLDGRPSHRTAKQALTEAAETIGDMPASAVRPQHVVTVLRKVYARGAVVQADKTRQAMSAAFGWGLKAANDYTVTTQQDWGLDANPVAAVPRDQASRRVGTRWLQPGEFFQLLAWARARTNREHVLVIALTGQRVQEIQNLRPDQWDAAQGLLYWPTTKTGVPHCIPVVDEVATILTRRRRFGWPWLFPRVTNYCQPIPPVTTRHALHHFSQPRGIEEFSPRDLRRTWKTLAGMAGISKADRDALQNHRARDVSAIHYDRYDGIAEKRAAIARWQLWLQQQDGRQPPQANADRVVHGQQ